jgi:predicted nucleic-acid-binding Zn-ribbon protein
MLLKRCKNCGHVDNRFYQIATISATAIVDEKGKLVEWKHIDLENPDFDDSILLCRKCQKSEFDDVEEDEDYLKKEDDE